MKELNYNTLTTTFYFKSYPEFKPAPNTENFVLTVIDDETMLNIAWYGENGWYCWEGGPPYLEKEVKVWASLNTLQETLERTFLKNESK